MTMTSIRQALALVVLSLTVVATMGTSEPEETGDWAADTKVIATDDARILDASNDEDSWNVITTIFGASQAGITSTLVTFEGLAVADTEDAQVVLSIIERSFPEPSEEEVSDGVPVEPISAVLGEIVVDVAEGGEPMEFAPQTLDVGPGCADGEDECQRRFRLVITSAGDGDITIVPQITLRLEGFGFAPGVEFETAELGVPADEAPAE